MKRNLILLLAALLVLTELHAEPQPITKSSSFLKGVGDKVKEEVERKKPKKKKHIRHKVSKPQQKPKKK